MWSPVPYLFPVLILIWSTQCQDIQDLRAADLSFFYTKQCVEQGCLVGRTEAGNKKPYEAYYGIPYAAPPVGKLRFKGPADPEPFDGLWDSTYHRQPCMQNSLKTNSKIIGSEDCLYLNVYRPKFSKWAKSLPVLVFFHGGSWKFGRSDPQYYGPDYLMDKRDMIVVTVQYRLGVFGFLASGDTNCKGNFGLKDQQKALQWVQDNIEQFGGDPNAVTLMGEDTGAASVHFHMMSPQSDDLFKKAILIGGTGIAFWSFREDEANQFKVYAKLTGIKKASTTANSAIIATLKGMSAKDLQKASHAMFSFHKVSKVFRPVIEGTWSGAFMTQNPFTTWQSGDYQQRPFWMIGAGYEAGLFADILYNYTARHLFYDDFDQNLMLAADLKLAAVKPIKKYYFGGEGFPMSNFKNILNVSLR